MRVDTAIYAGYRVPAHYDAMVAKLIVRGDTREEAICRMGSALREFTIEGIQTTIPFHQQLMRNERFLSGAYTTSFVEQHMGPFHNPGTC